MSQSPSEDGEEILQFCDHHCQSQTHALRFAQDRAHHLGNGGEWGGNNRGPGHHRIPPATTIHRSHPLRAEGPQEEHLLAQRQAREGRTKGDDKRGEGVSLRDVRNGGGEMGGGS